MQLTLFAGFVGYTKPSREAQHILRVQQALKLADTRVGGSSLFLGERFVFATRAARGGVGGFLLLVKKSVMERCCDILRYRERERFGKGAVYSFQRITWSTG